MWWSCHRMKILDNVRTCNEIQEVVDLCGWHEQFCLGCLWWWNASPVKQCMLSCSTEPVPSKIRYPFLYSLKSDLVCHYRKNLSPGVPSARVTVTLSVHSWARYPHPYPRFHSQWRIVDSKMEQENATTFLIVWAQLPPRQHLLPVVPYEYGDDAFFRSLHPMEQLQYAWLGWHPCCLRIRSVWSEA